MELNNKVKLSLLYLAITAPITNSLANDLENYDSSDFEGWTIGAGAGASTFMTNISTRAITADSSLNNFASNQIYKFAPVGTLFVGANTLDENNIFYGMELGLSFYGSNQTKLSSTSTAITTVLSTEGGDFDGFVTTNKSLYNNTIVKRNSLEPFLDLKLGFLVNPLAIAYFRAGVNYNSLQITSNSSYASASESQNFHNGESSVSTASSINITEDKNIFGLRLGFGTEYLFAPNTSFGLNYLFTFYHTHHSNSHSPVADTTCDAMEGCVTTETNLANDSRAKARDQKIMAQLIYHFNKK